MATHRTHEEKKCFYFITFTCYQWLLLIEESNLFPFFHKSFAFLTKKGVNVCGYVLMPNHVHLLIYIRDKCQGLNKAIAETKRFLSYDIVKRLKQNKRYDLLSILEKGVQENEKVKGKKHQVFRLSFDGKKLEGERGLLKVLDYIHQNPVQGKWSLVEDYTDYPYSSAGYYEKGIKDEFIHLDYRQVFSASSTE